MLLTLGSSSAILANNLSIWGAKVAFMGKLGKDAYSELGFKHFTKIRCKY